jgi:hypothetical protein
VRTPVCQTHDVGREQAVAAVVGDAQIAAFRPFDDQRADRATGICLNNPAKSVTADGVRVPPRGVREVAVT